MKLKKVLAVIISIVIIAAVIPFTVFAEKDDYAKLQIGVISDVHYYTAALKGPDGTKSDAFKYFCRINPESEYDFIEDLLDSALAAFEGHSKENGMKYVFIPGDLTANGEYENHVALAARLKEFEQKTGIQVLVINGNHDINNSNGVTFADGTKKAAKKTTPEEFREIYADLGYDLAYHTFTPSAGKKAGMLSYSVRLPGKYRLIAMDGGKYSPDNTKAGNSEHETAGKYSDELLEWIYAEMADARAKGETIIGLTHFNFASHALKEQELLQSFTIADSAVIAEKFADAGMRYVFSGHFHRNDVASVVSDDGETLYDIASGSLMAYPNFIKEFEFDNTQGDNKVAVDMKTYPVDCVKKVVYEGKTIDDFTTFSFDQCYRKGDMETFASDYARGFLDDLIEEIAESGGIMAYLSKKGIDVEALIKDKVIGDGVSVMGLTLVDSENFMGLINDIASQIDKKYIEDPDHLYSVLDKTIAKLLSFKVSDIPCTKFKDTLGFSGEGTLGNLVLSCMTYMNCGDEDISDDEFVKDAIDQFENGDSGERFFNFLLDMVIHDLVEDEILSNIDLHVRSFFPRNDLTKYVGLALDVLLNAILLGDTSLMHIANFVFSLHVLPYDSLSGVVNGLLGEYITQSQYESIGHTLAEFIKSTCVDSNPGEKMDNNAVLKYDGPVKVTPSRETYQIPANIAVTVGPDAATSRNLSWYTKWSIEKSEIQIVPYSKTPDFSKGTTVKVKIDQKDTKTTLSYPAVDFGVIGLIDYNFPVVRHTAAITGLEAGKKYCYRVGNAERGWWSDVGVFNMADNSDELTFLHIADVQSQTQKQYDTFKNVLKTAFGMFPDIDLIVNTGDHVDHGDNANQWRWMFDESSEYLMNTVMMPASGNHEDKGEYAIDRNFLLSNVPTQDVKTGVYYSFDYNNVHFIVLNSNNLSEETKGLSDEQIAWLKADASASNADWKVAVIHKAPYSNGSHFDDKDVSAIRDQLSVLMPELGIDVVLQGHDHVYMRTDVMDKNKVVETQTQEITYGGQKYTAKLDPKGTIYVISACAGVKNYIQKDVTETDKEFPRAESTMVTENPVFSAFRIVDDTLYFDAYMINDDGVERLDSFAIVKELSKDKKPTAPVVENETDDKTVENSDVSPNTGDNAYTIIAIVPLAFSAVMLLAMRRRKKKSEEK